ncbi:hypothetical protein [Roseobacter fucihabitans]
MSRPIAMRTGAFAKALDQQLRLRMAYNLKQAIGASIKVNQRTIAPRSER